VASLTKSRATDEGSPAPERACGIVVDEDGAFAVVVGTVVVGTAVVVLDVGAVDDTVATVEVDSPVVVPAFDASLPHDATTSTATKTTTHNALPPAPVLVTFRLQICQV
jgi:hypothetical protein